MAISNTNILIKRSSSTATPSGLKAGEFAYSYVSNTLFIGNSTGTGVVNVGGLLYTQTIDQATNANTGSTLVKRAADGSFAGQLFGNANTATTLQTAQNFSISGGDITATSQSFNGSAGVTLSASLNSVSGLSAGYYGGSTAIPVVQVAANGRIMSISNTSLSTSFTVSGNTGSGTQNTGGTLTVQGAGGSGINTTITGSGGSETITIATDSTLLRSNTTGSIQTVGTDVQISGNLIVSGTYTYSNSSIVQTTDSLIELASNNVVGDVIDIGFYGLYNNGSANLSTGLVRDAGSKNYYLFANVAAAGVTNANTINSAYFTAQNTATLYANVNSYSATVGTLTLTNALTVPSGGTGATSFTNGQVVLGQGTGALVTLANVSSINTSIAANSTINNLTTDTYGRVTNYTTQAISGLTVGQGGTGNTTFQVGSILIGNGTGALQVLANTSYTATGAGAANNTITSLTVDAYGRTTAATYTAISGLTVGQGGTGVSSFTTNGITYGNGSGAMQVTAAAGTSDQTWSNQILTVNNSGVPVWSTAMDGGTF